MKTNQALRFLTAGSVDDGKSTLIGRLLYDSRAILTDQLDALHAKAAGAAPDLSLLTDGLEAEREQGITIDVAYRYFSTKQRKFIIADAPGHEQYTRNMVTAAAGSDAAVVLVDVTKLDTATQTGRPVQLLPQTRRHALLAQLLRVPSIVFAVNKLDAVSDPAQAFTSVEAALKQFAEEAGMTVAAIVPVSALRGDNIAQRIDVPWYRGPSLLQVLEALPAGESATQGAFAQPLQFIQREGEGVGHQARTLWGRIAQGGVGVGDEVQVFPSGQKAVVAQIKRAGLSVPAAAAGESAGVVLDRQLDVSRGDWLLSPDTAQATTRFAATLAWLDVEPAVVGRKYWLRHGHRWVQGRITAIEHALDIHTLQPVAAESLAVNAIGRVQFEVQQALPLAPFAHNRVAGALIVVDASTHRTSGAVLVERPL